MFIMERRCGCYPESSLYFVNDVCQNYASCRIPCYIQTIFAASSQRDFLVELCAKAASWSDTTYSHAIGHIENVISNLRCDLGTERKLHMATQGQLAVAKAACLEVARKEAQGE